MQETTPTSPPIRMFQQAVEDQVLIDIGMARIEALVSELHDRAIEMIQSIVGPGLHGSEEILFRAVAETVRFAELDNR